MNTNYSYKLRWRHIGGNLTALLVLCSGWLPLSGQQNMIDNGSFENGLNGWAQFWSRTAHAGSVSVVSNVFYDGGHSAFIEHHDAQDWSFAVNKRYPVKAGEIYEYSAWVQTEQAEWANLSVITYDENQQVIEWSFAGRNIAMVQDHFVLNTTQFIVPEGVCYINPRFIGGGESRLFVDAATLLVKGEIGAPKEYSLENSLLRVDVLAPGLALQVKDKQNGIVYQCAPVNGLLPTGVDSGKISLTFFCTNLSDHLDMTVRMRLDQDYLSIQLAADSTKQFSTPLIFPGPCTSRPTDYLIIPRGTGYIQPVSEEYPFWDFTMYSWKSTMSFVGVTDLHSGYMLVSDNPWDTRIEFPRLHSYVAPQMVHMPVKDHFSERTFYFVPIRNNGYVEMCQWYRGHVQDLGYLKSWSVKIRDNAYVDRLRGAVDFWLLDERMQTRAFIDSLLLYGLDRAIISLSAGWYATKDKHELIDYINANNLLSSRYDIYTDVWPADHPEYPWYRTQGYPQDVIVDQDGSLRKGWLAYLDGNVPFQGYYACSQTHEPYADTWIGNELATQHYNGRFIDVELASALTECYSPDHPCTRQQDAQFRTRLLEKVKTGFNLVTGSEEAHDWAFPTVDYGEGAMTMRPQDNAGYDWANPVTDPEPDYEKYNISPLVRLPLHGLVYHDVHVATWYTGDGQSKVPRFWEAKDLWNILYASMPLFAPPSMEYWQKNKEKYLTSYFLVCSVFRECGFSSMTHHQFLDADHQVQQTDFANGWQVVANFSAAPYSWQQIKLAPNGFHAGNGQDVVYKIMTGGQPLAVCRLQDRLFLNPYGQPFEGYGIRSNGPLLLKKEDNQINLAWIGQQTQIEFNPAELPWQMGPVRIFALDNVTEVKPEPVANGWLRLVKKNKMPFYHIKGSFTSVKQEEDQPTDFNMTVCPNPFNAQTRITLTAPAHAPVSLRLYNILGKEVKTLCYGPIPADSHTLTLSANELATGVYFLQFSAKDQKQVQKILLLR